MKIVIIKLGAAGDVIRTLPIAKAMKEKYKDAEITWITKDNIADILKPSEFIDNVYTLPYTGPQQFNLLYNFDIEDEATQLALIIKADKKYGFSKEGNFPVAFNFGAEEYLNTFFDDEVKKENQKTYQELMFNAAELTYKREHVGIILTKEDREYALKFFQDNKILKYNVLGIHMGASSRWPSKVWHESKLIEFIQQANKKNYEIIIFGGPNEAFKHEALLEKLEQKNIIAHANNPDNTNRQFASLIERCTAIICSDSFALHVALALKKPTIGLFFCTSPHEVESYGLLKKVVSPLLKDFFPEHMNEYNEELVKSISPQEVLEALEDSLKIDTVTAIIKHPTEEKVLIIQRSIKDSVHNNLWAFPGGRCEQGESVKQTLQREVKEEVGLDIKSIGKKIADYTYPIEKGILLRGASYFVFPTSTETEEGLDVQALQWVTPEELKNYPHIDGMEDEILKALYS
ncbi:MAG: glycosyltransferase family 9 protein [Nanoarchaeota archaeon]|nr:glycosyltransferase family 9 protein [Nanoarchaeota archaeon]